MLVCSQSLNKMHDVTWYQGGVRLSWCVNYLAKFDSQFGLLEGSWPVTLEISCPFLVSLWGNYHQQVTFPASATASLTVYAPALIKGKILEVWIVTDYACTQFICALLSGPAMLLAVKNPGDFLTLKTFCNSLAE